LNLLRWVNASPGCLYNPGSRYGNEKWKHNVGKIGSDVRDDIGKQVQVSHIEHGHGMLDTTVVKAAGQSNTGTWAKPEKNTYVRPAIQ
jgi:hypothetical protein